VRLPAAFLHASRQPSLCGARPASAPALDFLEDVSKAMQLGQALTAIQLSQQTAMAKNSYVKQSLIATQRTRRQQLLVLKLALP
jgi:hypothetical protein